ncbi:hypothetical protein [Caenispirillum bisanense]|uniref:hypothetical protein n=1 Tax=Caenispirillum bisanense TaxID=414052 RepID=UPI0031E44A70
MGIPSIRETAASLEGLRRIVRMDPTGLDCFNASVQGFWNSFFVAVLTLPFYLLQAGVYYMNADIEASAARFLSLELMTFVLGWLVYPVVMVTVTQVMDRWQHYLRYMVAYNWFQLVVAALLLPLSLLQLTGMAPDGLIALLFLMATSAFLLYGWFIANRGLDLGGATAAGIVILDLALSLLVNGATDLLLKGAQG